MKVWVVTDKHHGDNTVAGIGDSFAAAVKIANRHYKIGRPSDTADLEFLDSYIAYGNRVYWARIGPEHLAETYYLEETAVESV